MRFARSPDRLLMPLALLLALLLGPAGLAPAARADDEAPAPTSRFFETYDQNGDGRVTTDEFQGDPAVFRLLDLDQDGVISPQDLGLPADYKPERPAPPRDRPARDGAGERPAPPRGGPGRGPGRERPPGDGAGGPGAEELGPRLAPMDANGDGRVSKEEWQGPAEAFERFDRNGDGFLDAADMAGLGRPDRRTGGGAGAFLEGLKRMDADGDGKVSKAEFKGPEGFFARLDANGDGFVDEAEVAAMASRMGGPGGGPPTPEQTEARFREMDANGDGKLDGGELPRPEMLARLDADKDGAVSKEEFAAAGRGRGERTPGISAEALRRFDTNGDGKVTRDEFPGGGERFDRLDRNKDGALTAEDFPADGAPPTPPVTPTPKGVVEANDKDGNGRLSRNEFPGSDEDWRALDKDQDGWITPAEAAAR